MNSYRYVVHACSFMINGFCLVLMNLAFVLAVTNFFKPKGEIMGKCYRTILC